MPFKMHDRRISGQQGGNIEGAPGDGPLRRPIWWKEGSDCVEIIDQRLLPHEIRIEELRTVTQVFSAIRDMQVRGAPLIGVTAACGMYFAVRDARGGGAAAVDEAREAASLLLGARPTAVNLKWAVDRVLDRVLERDPGSSPAESARVEVNRLIDEEIHRCRRIGEHGLPLLAELAKGLDRPLNVLTHCNAGWLACVEYGTATAPIYMAHGAGVPVHVWVDETRPRNQGARLTAWELGQSGVPHTVIVDNAGGHLMQRGLVDVVIVGSDRTTRSGDVVNKIGTYLKALAARDCGVPFYVALPSSSIDWTVERGDDVPIEERDPAEVRFVEGSIGDGIVQARVPPRDSPVANHGFDVTPARLVTGLITERGVSAARESALVAQFPEMAHG